MLLVDFKSKQVSDSVNLQKGDTKMVKVQEKAIIDGSEIRCSRHGRRVGRVTDEGIELWCKSEGGHPVVISYKDLLSLFCK
jgi:hypothetical protein